MARVRSFGRLLAGELTGLERMDRGGRVGLGETGRGFGVRSVDLLLAGELTGLGDRDRLVTGRILECGQLTRC